MLTILDEDGYFIRLYLNELEELGRLLYPRPGTIYIRDEIHNLTDMLDNLTKRKRGEKIQTTIRGKYVCTGIVMIGTYDKILDFGPDPYINYIMSEIGKGTKRLYIMAAGRNIGFAKDVVKRIAESGVVELVSEQEYMSRNLEGMPIKFLLSLLVSKTNIIE
jgi:hypothetical protein